jgi:hypothetical protein
MRTLTQWYRLAAVAAAVGTFGCKSLEVTNPNSPDAARAFSDPAAVAALVTGAMRQWYNSRGGYYPAMALLTMADSYTASWNNAQMRYYSSYGPIGNAQANCPQRCGWTNIQSASTYPPVEAYWYDYYGMLSSVNDVLTAIRRTDPAPVVLGDDATTKMHEAIAVMLQGIVFANISINYDKGFVVTEATDISNPAAIPFTLRAEMRDSAIAKFNQAIALLTATPFDATPTTWYGGQASHSYSSTQYIQLINTMKAEAYAYYARDPVENAAVNWDSVKTWAAQGLSKPGAEFDFEFYADLGATVFDAAKGNGVNFMRVDSRFANLITGGYPDALGSGPVYRTPYTLPEPQPNSADHRLGDGSWGPEDDVSGAGTVAEDAGAGTDYAWSPVEPFRVARGTYHQTSLMHIRYSYLASPGSGLPTENGRGLDPFYAATHNDLLWAEALLLGSGSTAEAAALINKTRVDRGHLAPLDGSEGLATLTLALQYEQEVEEMGQGESPFINRRRETPEGWAVGAATPSTVACPAIMCLWPGTPRQMPVPAKELNVLQQELYSFGGPDLPDFSPSFVGGEAVFSARQVAAAMHQASLQKMRARTKF